LKLRFAILTQIELKPNANYMSQMQPELDWGMRTKLVSWIMQVHIQFKLLPETLYLAVNIIDRFLSLRCVSVSKLQLVGVAALMIASKYEEIMAPCIGDLAYITDNAYDKSEIIAAEKFILQTLSFQIGYPNPLNFLRNISKVDGHDRTTRTLAKYFCQVSLLEPGFLAYPSSAIAASSMFLAIKVVRNGEWVLDTNIELIAC
jgi:G2/mitotic-specific cyclin 2